MPPTPTSCADATDSYLLGDTCPAQHPVVAETSSAPAAGSATAEAPSAGSSSGWRIRPNTLGRSVNLSVEELAELRQEELAARGAELGWEERGPPRTGSSIDVSHWRGQEYRTGKNGGQPRYANRGGRHREYYANLARQGVVGGSKGAKGKNWPGQGKGKDKDFGESSGKGKKHGKDTGFGGKGKDEGKDKG